MGQCYHGLIHTESSYLLPAIPHPAHPHGWCSDGHGRHTWSHCTSLLPASLYYYCWCGQCRLHRHADFGWRWWSPSLTKGRAGPSGHCAVCALQRLQNGQCFLHLLLFTCWLSASSSIPLYLSSVLLMKMSIKSYSYNAPLLFKRADRQVLPALPVVQMGIMDWRRSRNFLIQECILNLVTCSLQLYNYTVCCRLDSSHCKHRHYCEHFLYENRQWIGSNEIKKGTAK